MATRLLLTGADGFVGRATTSLLRDRGFEVVRTDRRGSVDLLGDLTDSAFVATLPDVECIVHAAAVQYVSDDLPWLYRKRYFEQNNVLATGRLCERYGPTGAHFVNIATSMMYRQNNGTPLRTVDAMEGQGVYSRSKLEAQQRVEKSFRRWSTIIPCIIGGPGRGGLFTGFVKSIRTAGIALVPGAGEHLIHMVHVDDVAELIRTVVTQQALGFFNAAAPEPLSIVQWVENISSELSLPTARVFRLPLRPVDLAAKLSGYRLLAREQVLMLSHQHLLDVSGSRALGWSPINDNACIVRETAREIVTASAING